MAIADCKAVLEIEPTNMKAHLRAGTALLEVGKLDEALGHFLEVKKAEKDNSQVSTLL